MREIYLWKDWFTELAGKIVDGGEACLAEAAKKVKWRDDNKVQPLLDYGDENIDPFSFFYSLAQRSQDAGSRERIYPSIKEAFGMEWYPPVRLDDAFIFPTPSYNTLVLFHNDGQGNPQLLWSLFRSAVRGLDSVDAGDFDGALDIGNVGKVKLTQTLFLINSSQFIPCDDKMSLFVDLPNSEFNWPHYREWLQKVRDLFPGCEPYEINLFSYLGSTDRLPVHSDRCFQVSTRAWGPGEGDLWNGDDPQLDRYYFEPNNWVFTGGGPDRYPAVRDPRRGDVILVRTGWWQGRGVGIVYKNDHEDQILPVNDSRVHVVWVNKEPGRLSRRAPTQGFTRAWGGTIDAFRHASGMRKTFELLDRLSGLEDPMADERIPQNLGVEHPRNQILYGPPGTGKTYHTVARALAIVDGRNVRERGEGDIERFHELRRAGQVEMVTFHQNYAYEDFIEGIRPVLDEAADGRLGYERHDGIFKQIADAARGERGRRFVLIIDEINRGNIAKIFGELITLIEDSRRLGANDATEVRLPYSNDSFGVPNNLYLIGTMNTADRSIQLLDTALRRRFDFVEMMPNYEHIQEIKSEDEEVVVDCKRMLEIMNARITALLDRERQIGHSYLLGVDTMDKLSDTFRNRIFPLLQEYFFDDWSKIRAVLGRNESFVQMEPEQATKSLFVGHEQVADEARAIYKRLPDSHEMWTRPDQYRRIYETPDQ